MMKALVVDDDRVLADVLSFTLRREGFQVIQAFDGEVALQRWAEEEPDLIITRSTVRRLMEMAVDHMLRLGSETVEVYIECLEGELDGYESSRGFEY